MFTDPKDIVVPTMISHYRIDEIIGVGAYAVVRVVYDVDRGIKLACKIIPRIRLASEDLEDRFEQEIRVLQQMNHRNIVQLYDLIKDDNNYYIIMELCPNGELFQTIVDRKYLPEHESKKILYQICSALSYVHDMGAVHRDMKPENLLLSGNGEIKISDFGFSRYVGNGGLVATSCGSPCYASPECLSGSPYDGTKSDVWSSGVIFYAMVTGQLPWTKRNQNQLFDQIRRGDYKIPSHLSEGCQQMIKGMMNVDIHKRFSAKDVINHRWLSDCKPNKINSSPILGVSLKTVDKFFNKEEKIDVSKDLDARRISSAPGSNFRSIVKQIIKPSLNLSTKLPPLASSNSTKTTLRKTRLKSLPPKPFSLPSLEPKVRMRTK